MTKNAKPLACIILAAGFGTRMKSKHPKVLHKVAGLPLIQHVLNASKELRPEQIVVVIGEGAKEIEKAVSPYPCVIQKKPLGTGDAVKAARKELGSFKGDIAVLFAADPLFLSKSLHHMQEMREKKNASIVVAGFTADNPAAYGRLVLNQMGDLEKIVENSEASPQEKMITLCNGGVMLFDGPLLWPLLDQLRDNNAKKEFFLTDCIALARQRKNICTVVEISQDEVLGVNDRVELAEVEKIMQKRLREKAMLSGVTMTDPDSVFLSADTEIGNDVTIGPFVVIGPKVKIENNVEIRAFCQLEDVHIEEGAVIGPFARLRPGSHIGPKAHIGNFVEIKNSKIGAESKVNHLSYVGDASVGTKTNIGAGTITANYDGFTKSRTHIGDNASTGSNSVLVAPVKIGDGAYIAAGSIITQDVPADALALARERQENKTGWAKRMREKKTKK